MKLFIYSYTKFDKIHPFNPIRFTNKGQKKISFFNRNSKSLDSTSGYWAEPFPAMESPLCAVIDPARDFRWHALRCGGPETAAFLCEMEGKETEKTYQQQQNFSLSLHFHYVVMYENVFGVCVRVHTHVKHNHCK